MYLIITKLNDISDITLVMNKARREVGCLDMGRRGSRGGGQGGLAPPPIFWGKLQGANKHIHRKKKSYNHEAKYRLKRTQRHSKYAQIFKKNLVRWGGGGGKGATRGNILFIKVIKSKKLVCSKSRLKHFIF